MSLISHKRVSGIDADGLRLDLGNGQLGLVPIKEIFVDGVEPIRLSRTIYQGKLCVLVGDSIPVVPLATGRHYYSRRNAVIQAASQAFGPSSPSTVSVRILEIAFDEISCLADAGYEMVLDRRLTEEAIATDPLIKRRLSPEKVPERSWLYPGDYLYAKLVRLIAPGKIEGELVLHGRPVLEGQASAYAAVSGPPAAPPSGYEEVVVVDDEPSIYKVQVSPYFTRGGYDKVALVSNLPELERWLMEYLPRQRQRAREEKRHFRQGQGPPRAAGLLAIVRLDADPRAFRWEDVCKALVANTSGVDVILLCHGHIDFARRLRKRIDDNRDAYHVRNIWSLTFGLRGLGALIAGLSAVDRGDAREHADGDDDGNCLAVPSLYRYRTFEADCTTALSSILQIAGDRTRPHAAILFRIHRQLHEVDVECAVGDRALVDGFHHMSWHLHKSPVRDLAIYGRDADTDDASTESGRYLYFLLPAGGEATNLSVMGRRLASPPDSAYAHVAFLFSRHLGAFSNNSSLASAFTVVCTALQTALMARSLDGRLEQISETAELAFDFRHMSHEAVALLRDSLPMLEPPVRAPKRDRLRENARRAMVLLRRVLDARLDCTYESFDPIQVANAILARCAGTSRTMCQANGTPNDGVQTEVVRGNDLPEIVVASRIVFECVLRNLVLNSFVQILEYSGGRGTISVRLELTCDEDGQRRVVVSVVDDGPGIHGRYWEDVFVTGVSTREKGTGFGLSLSRRLLAEVRGELALVSSHVYGGSEFRFSLPLKEQADLRDE